MSDDKKISMIHQQGSLAGEFTTFMHQFGWWDFACTLQKSPNHNIHGKNGVYHRWTTYALKSKSVSEMHIPMIW